MTRSFLHTLGKDQSGATAVEYGLIAGLIVIGMLAGLTVLADGTTGLWGSTQTEASEAMAIN